jgi:hypothetical protein
MVSPVDKNNGDIINLTDIPGYSTGLYQSAASGEKITYTSYRAFGDAQSAPWAVQYLASRDPADGWSSKAVSPAQGPNATFNFENNYKAFSSELSYGWLRLAPEPSLAPGEVDGAINLFRRDDLTHTYETLTTAEQGLNVESEPALGRAAFDPELQGSSADGSKSFFRAKARLTSDAHSGIFELYDSSAGVVRLVCVLPNGAVSTQACSAGTATSSLGGEDRENRVAGAMSDDGSRLYWTSFTEDIGSGGPGTLYLRENPSQPQSAMAGSKCTEPEKACTVKVSETVSPEPARFLTASSDGSKALFTVGENLYEFDLESKHSTFIAHKVQGLLGASEDASYIYFLSTEALAGAAQPGQPNLYLFRSGSGNSYIATLSESDIKIDNMNRPTDIAIAPIAHVARVTPDGRHLAFMSHASLTGYDNTDVVDGEADSEVYIYEAGTPRPVCVSCNPSGQRPHGGVVEEWAHDAAFLPGWESQLYASRVLSDSGSRLFFDIFDSLVPRDTNGQKDVYEWEMPGTGSCSTSSASYSQLNAGCVGLISSGEGSQDSEFKDASTSGNDVFFTTQTSLVPQDTGLIDMYDARVDGGFASSGGSTQCEGEACQNPPAPPIDTTPGSMTFSGAGNISVRPAATVTPKTKPLTRAQKLAQARKACRSKPRKKRAGCEAKARKRYGPAEKSSVSGGRAKTRMTTKGGK